MANRKKVWMAQVDPRLPEDPKFIRYARMLRPHLEKLENIHEHVAFGLLVRLWCVTMRDDDTGKLDSAPEEIAEKLKWVGPPVEALIDALLNCGRTSVDPDKPGFVETRPDGYAIYKWAEWQNDPAGKRERWAEAKRSMRQQKGGPPAPTSPPADFGPKEESVRQILQAMTGAKTPGSPAQKREYAAAWIERPDVGGARVLEILMSPEARGQGIFWLDARLGGRPSGGNGSTQKSNIDKLKEWAKGSTPPATAGGKA